jgi:hypothetical protein
MSGNPFCAGRLRSVKTFWVRDPRDTRMWFFISRLLAGKKGGGAMESLDAGR